jgi:hypothetical protein
MPRATGLGALGLLGWRRKRKLGRQHCVADLALRGHVFGRDAVIARNVQVPAGEAKLNRGFALRGSASTGKESRYTGFLPVGQSAPTTQRPLDRALWE